MITCNLKGGIGNQLYQIAAGYSLALENNVEFFYYNENRWTAMQGHHPGRYLTSLYRNIKQNNNLKPEFIYLEKEFRYNKIPFLKNRVVALDGYFQSYKYFKNHLDKIRDVFTFDDKMNLKVQSKLQKYKDKGKHIVGIHTRGGDYKLNPHIFPQITPEYYKKAKSYFDDNTVFVYCTDDRSTLNQFQFDENNLFINGDELLDLCVLSNCDSLIIANSSFSAWASYLVKEKEKVFCPDQWLGTEVCDDLFDPSWQKIKI